MSMFLYIILIAILLGMLWLASKFLGKIGLFCLGTAMFVCVPLFDIDVLFLGANLGCFWLFLALGIFIICYVLEKYGIQEGLKLGCVVVCSTIFVYVSLFFIYLFAGSGFGFALVHGLLEWIGLMLALGASLFIGLFLREFFVVDKFSKKFREFLILSIMFFVATFIFGIFVQLGDVAFLNIFLNILIVTLVLIVFAGILILFSILALKLNDNSEFSEKILNEINKIIEKVKSKQKSKTENVTLEDEENDEYDDIKLEGIFADDEDETESSSVSQTRVPKKRPPKKDDTTKND